MSQCQGKVVVILPIGQNVVWALTIFKIFSLCYCRKTVCTGLEQRDVDYATSFIFGGTTPIREPPC